MTQNKGMKDPSQQADEGTQLQNDDDLQETQRDSDVGFADEAMSDDTM